MKRIGTIRDILVFVLVICTIGTNQARAKSVYAITDHELSTLKAYMIDGDQLEYQEDVNVTDYALGAVGITIDSNLELLFITYEDAGKIVWANAKTLQQEGFIDLSGAPCYAGNLTGIVADEAKQRVYVVERYSNKLYILSWNNDQDILILMDPQDPNQPYSSGDPYISLAGLYGDEAWGIALDETTRRLYVTDTTTNVHVYYADDPNWTHLGPRDVGREAMAIAVDPNNGEHNAFLYVGGFKPIEGGYHTFLVKHDLEADVNPNTEQNIEAVATGLAVDKDTGLVYCTTAEYSPEDYEVRVYDCYSYPFTCTYWVDTGGTKSGPAGVCVPTGDVSYKPSFLNLEKLDDVNDGVCVIPGDDIMYTISYSYPNEPNNVDINDLNLIDYLPNGIEYLSSDSCGTYDPNNHTVTWYIGTLEPNESNSVTMTVKVKECIYGCGVIENFCEIKSVDSVQDWDHENTPVCCASNPWPTCEENLVLYIDKALDFNLTWCPVLYANTSDKIPKKCLTNTEKCSIILLIKTKLKKPQEELNIKLKKPSVLAMEAPSRE